jgi:capsular polysaccharide transport system permease protein
LNAIFKNPLRRSFQIQIRVIAALLLREILTRYGRNNIGFLWLFVEPMLFTLAIIGLWTAISGERASHLPIIAFAITGYSSVLLWRNMPGRCSNAIESNLSLMYHRNVKILDIFISRIILEFMGCTISFVFLLLLFITANWINPPENVLKIIAGWFMLAWFGASLAVLIGSLSARMNMLEKIWTPFTIIMFPMSGAGFMVDWLPTNVQNFVLLLPMVHGVEILREGYFGSVVSAHYDIGYMATWCLVLTLFALSQAHTISRKISPA